MANLVCGVDEAGRGPVIGPLVMACVVADDDAVRRLREMGVRDSKKLSPTRRLELEPEVKEAAVEWKTVHISPQEIDRMRKTMSLNQLEAERTVDMLLKLRSWPQELILDAPDPVEAKYGMRVAEHLMKLKSPLPLPRITSEHKADDTYPVVSAASVIAKVERDRAVDSLKERYGDFGSGYPGDPLTAEYVRRVIAEGRCPDCVRKSWSTVDKGKQARLQEYL